MGLKLRTTAAAALLVLASATGVAEPMHPASAAAQGAAQASRSHLAGKYFYICYTTAGTSVTLRSGQAVYSGCRGAARVAQYLDNGQLVQVQSLAPGGSRAHAKFTGTADCYVAIGAFAFAVLNFDNSWVWYAGAVASGYGLHACVSG